MRRIDDGDNGYPACDSCCRKVAETILVKGTWRLCPPCYDREYGTGGGR